MKTRFSHASRTSMAWSATAFASSTSCGSSSPNKKSKAMPFILYCVTCSTTGRKYFGQTVRSLRCRWKSHVAESIRLPKSKRPLCKAIRKYGEAAFLVEELLQCSCAKELNFVEEMAIRLYRSLGNRAVYNVADGGGRGSGWKQKPSTKEKISLAHKGRPCCPTTAEAVRKAHLGKRASGATRARMSFSGKLFWRTIEGREAQRQRALLRWHGNASV